MICSKCGLPQGTHGIDGGTGMCLACRAKHTADMHDDYDAVVAERDELRAKLDQVRSEIGCARGQRTTQFCAEAVEYKRRLDAVVKMLKPTPELIANAKMDFQASFELEVTGGFHARAVAIAEGRES